MATNYPGQSDTFENPMSSDQLDSTRVPHDEQHANMNDAMAAVQQALGPNPANAWYSVAARLDDYHNQLSALNASISGVASPRVLVLDTATSNSLPDNTLVTGDFFHNDYYWRHEIGGTTPSSYSTGSFPLIGTILATVDLTLLAAPATGDCELALLKDGDVITRVTLQTDRNLVIYDGAGAPQGASGAGTFGVGDLLRFSIALHPPGIASAAAGYSVGAAGYQNGANVGTTRGSFTAVSGIADEDSISAQVSTTGTMQVGILRLQLSRGPI